MIYTVTLNPAIDYIVRLEHLKQAVSIVWRAMISMLVVKELMLVVS